MDLETDEPRTVKIEWRIENITCWWSGFHEPYIESEHSTSLPDFKVSLDPDVFRNGEMKVHCSFGKLRLFEGELSFFGPDESLIQTVEIMPVAEADEIPVIISAPDLIQIAKSQQADHGDHVILTFRFIVEDVLMAVGMCTTLEVLSDMVFPFTGSKLLEDSQLRDEPKLLVAITYKRPRENGKEEEERLNLERVFFGRLVDLQLRPITDWAFRDILILTNFKMWDHTNCLIRDDDSYQIFKRIENIGREPSAIVDEISCNDLSVRGSRVALRLKFISGKTKGSTSSEIFEGFPTDSNAKSSPEPLNDHPPLFEETENDSSLEKEFMSLYHDKEFTDFELHCENATFPVHKAILSARSPFFKQLFLSNIFKEEKSDSVDIEDMNAVTLNQFLAFLYSGTLDNLQAESAIKLYYAGYNYQVPTLKTECVKFLNANISVSNACSILSLADKCKDAQLTSSAQNFIKDNFKNVVKSEEWHSYTVSDPRLLVKTVSDFAAKGYFDQPAANKNQSAE